MSKFILRDILQEYDEIRREAAQALDLRRQEIAEKVPEVVKIHQDMIDLMAQRSREIILNPNTSSDAIDQLQEQITRLKARQLQLLEKKGYPRDYLEIKYAAAIARTLAMLAILSVKCAAYSAFIRNYQMSNPEPDVKIFLP